MTYEIDIRGRYCAVVECHDKSSLKWLVDTAKERQDISLIRVVRTAFGRTVVRTLAFEGNRWVGDLGDFL